MTNTTDINSESDSIENLLFSGLIYRIISEPDGLRKSMAELDIFLNASDSIDLNKNIQSIESAMLTVDRIKDRDGAFTAFESLVEGSRYNLIGLDRDFNYIFHNQKSESIISHIFNSDTPQKLDQKLINNITNIKAKFGESSARLISIPNIVNNVTGYLLSNTDNERQIYILLIPSHENNEFTLQEELAKHYEFTSKEKLVLTNLIAGCDVQQISDQFCVSLNTVRSHLKSIFSKTDTNSQSDLIRLFLKHETQFLDSYLEPVKSKQQLDASLSTTDLFIKLSTGNKICYRDYGPKDGRPLFVFHNLLGSRFHIPHQYSDILDRTNRRIIVPERPGYGRSDIHPEFNKIWTNMFNEFIDQLGISKFDLLGNVSGSVNAIAYAATNPSCLQSVILSSPLFFNTSGQNRLLGDFPYSASRMVAVSKRMANNSFRLWMKSMKFDTERYIRRMIKQYAGENELHILNNQKSIDRLVLNFTESQRNSSNGSAQDAVYSLSPLKVDLSKISLPFSIWVGTQDKCIPVSSAKEICAPIPNKTFHVREGYGEDIYYHLFEEIIG